MATEQTCEVCERFAAKRHPCRFERACACWYGVPCEPVGASYATMQRNERKARKAVES